MSRNPPNRKNASALAPITIRISDAMHLTGLSRPTIYRLIDAGKLKRRKVGDCALIDYQSLRDFLDAA